MNEAVCFAQFSQGHAARGTELGLGLASQTLESAVRTTLLLRRWKRESGRPPWEPRGPNSPSLQDECKQLPGASTPIQVALLTHKGAGSAEYVKMGSPGRLRRVPRTPHAGVGEATRAVPAPHGARRLPRNGAAVRGMRQGVSRFFSWDGSTDHRSP